MSIKRWWSSWPGRSGSLRLADSGALATSSMLVLGVSAVGGFVINLDQASIPVANPTIGSDLGATLRDFQWVINAFLLPLVVLLVAGVRSATASAASGCSPAGSRCSRSARLWPHLLRR